MNDYTETLKRIDEKMQYLIQNMDLLIIYLERKEQ